MFRCTGVLLVPTNDTSKPPLLGTHTHTSFLGHLRPDLLSLSVSVRECVCGNEDLLIVSVISDIRWLAEHAASLPVKVLAVWEHHVGEDWE